MLVGFLQFGDRRFVISGVKRHVAGEVRIKARLVWIVCFIERGFRGRNVLLRFIGLAAAGSDASLRTLPAEQPQIFVGVAQVFFVRDRFVSHLVPFEGVVGVAGFQIHA